MTNYRQTTRHADKIRATRATRRQKTAKHSGQPSAAREALRRLSAKIRAAMQTGSLPAAFDDCLTVNDCLRRGYQIQAHKSDFDTFAGWRARGYAVDKGAKGYPIWSKPRNHDDTAETSEDTAATDTTTEAATETTEGTATRGNFCVAYIFSAAQVHHRETGARPDTYNRLALACLPIPEDYQAELATITAQHAQELQQPTPTATRPIIAAETLGSVEIATDTPTTAAATTTAEPVQRRAERQQKMYFHIYYKHPQSRTYKALDLAEGRAAGNLLYATIIDNKAQAEDAARRLAAINPDCKFEARAIHAAEPAQLSLF